MIIVGGTYAERCRFPHWDRIFGSGLRAALAVSKISPHTKLHSYVHRDWCSDVDATLGAFGVEHALQKLDAQITFRYLHPFHKLGWIPERLQREAPIKAEGAVVLRFGMLESEACVCGERVVYDPQSDRAAFSANGSRAKQLALIVNQEELLQLGTRGQWPADRNPYKADKSELRSAAQHIFETESVDSFVIVVKHPLVDRL